MQKFQKKLPVSPGARESWLVQCVLPDGAVRWGCRVCSQQRQRPSFSKAQELAICPEEARLANLLRHAQTQAHRLAAQAYLAGQVDKGAGAPPP